MALYQNKYRIESTRLPGWDYGSASAYFITICTRHRLHWFGEIPIETSFYTCLQKDQKNIRDVQLTETGLIVQNEWLKSPALRPDMNIMLDEFVVMPNHFHGIIIIGENGYNFHDAGMDSVHDPCRDAMHGVSTEKSHDVSTEKSHGRKKTTENQFGPNYKNLGSVIRGFKSAVTMKARQINSDFAWQGRYHDHIIRNEESYARIRNYIIKNPINWKEDKFFVKSKNK